MVGTERFMVEVDDVAREQVIPLYLRQVHTHTCTHTDTHTAPPCPALPCPAHTLRIRALSTPSEPFLMPVAPIRTND